MNICVAGWYFHGKLLDTLEASAFPWYVVCHRTPSRKLPDDRHIIIPNVGLEFGCYNWYLMNKWTSGSVLFLHDDAELTKEMLDQIAGIPVDQCFLFSSEDEAKANGEAHGRAIFCSERFLKQLKANGGFWYNEAPSDGKEIPATTAGGLNTHNSGIQTFVAYLRRLPEEFAVNKIGIVPDMRLGYRGRM